MFVIEQENSNPTKNLIVLLHKIDFVCDEVHKMPNFEL